MAFAVGYAVTQPPLATLAVFAGLGLGFAAPLVALSFMPALQRRIPKPGGQECARVSDVRGGVWLGLGVR
ncbi:MAG: hypothetical protein WDM79_10285 [Terricaulis sp.]